MGYTPGHPRHRPGKPCPVCIVDLERKLGLRPYPRPPRSPGAPSRRPLPDLPNPGRRG